MAPICAAFMIKPHDTLATQIGGYFACPASAGSAEHDGWGRVWRSRSGPARTSAARSGKGDGRRNAWRLGAPGRYARYMEISPNRGNFPRSWVQVPPRTPKPVGNPPKCTPLEHACGRLCRCPHCGRSCAPLGEAAVTAQSLAPVIPPSAVSAGRQRARSAAGRPLPLARPVPVSSAPAGVVYGIGRIDASGRIADYGTPS
jgi:hypothetical protein